ncbi:MAG: sugar phosphate isomerase/epimerase [Chloroflexi bacterium]|nr:sugar phosphate isomerase/epimerase [Chloroflexota bacterium]MDL1883354.1 sugar phosphate isomerase/epimerase [Anaerolineae bacterium CFX8]GIL13069.1 MAG: AP endonuclease [Chloroflexota bacterium]
MSRPVTLFTGQWADLTLEDVAKKASAWGFDGLELACWGDHFEVDRALAEDGYVQSRWDILNKYNLKCFAISTHLVGQCVCDDPIDNRHKSILPARLWGDGSPEGVRQRAAEELKNTARAAKKFGVGVVNGFTGSSVWAKLYFFPPTSQADIEVGYKDFADRWLPILEVFKQEGVKYALEVHPTEIAYDIITSERALKAIDYHPNFGFNFDPSHFIHQLFDPVEFINEFPERVFHVHVKDSRVQLTGRNSILSSHLDFGDHRRGWDFVSPGRGDVKWDRIIRALNRIGYQGPLSIEWEDSGMDREWGAPEALKMVRSQDFTASQAAFDAAFAAKK